MKRLTGCLLLGFGLLIFWPVQIGLGLYGLYYIIMAFINAGVIAGLISIPIVGVILAITYIIIHLLTMPYILLVHSLLENKKQELNLREIKNQKVIENRRAEFEGEMAHIHYQLKKAYMGQGMTEQEADDKVKQDEEEIYANS